MGLSRGNRRDPAIRLLYSLRRDSVRVSRRRKKKKRLRRDARAGLSRVTEGTPRSAFCILYAAIQSGYRAVAKRRGAYAAMPVHKSVSRRREKKGRLRRDALMGISRVNQRDSAIRSLERPGAPGIFPEIQADWKPARLSFLPSFLCVLCALCANPVFQDIYKSVSRCREKKERLRRDALVGLGS